MFEVAYEPTIAQVHGEELLKYAVIALGLCLGAIISLLLWAVNNKLESMNNSITVVKNELMDDVQLLRDNQTTMWTQISETKKRVGVVESDIAVISSNCKIFHGTDRRQHPRVEFEED